MATEFISREHPVLLDTAAAVLEDLRLFRRRFRRTRVSHQQHDDFAERAISLEMYLSSALSLCARDQYLAAFAVLRAGLEHHLTDRLLFVGRRYKRKYVKVKKRDYEGLRREWEQGRPGTEDIVRIDWRAGTLVIVRSGVHLSGAAAPSKRTLSIYYFFLQDFDPFVGRPDEQAHLARGFSRVEDRIEHAERQRGIYNRTLRWEAIKSNLAENRICGAEVLRRFDVHYRFLSAFVHPMPAGYDLVYGHDRPTEAPRYDHYASELVLLYVNKLAAAELKYLKRMTTRPPSVRVSDWGTVEADVRSADAAAAHLWFPGDKPHAFDYVQEANSRGMRNGRLVPRDRRPSPSDLREGQVRYYRNPLSRLITMHQSFQEITGFEYVSPWPRDDARYRR